MMYSICLHISQVTWHVVFGIWRILKVCEKLKELNRYQAQLILRLIQLVGAFVILLAFLIQPALAEEGQGWEEMAELPKSRSELDAAVIEDKIYVVGGLDNRGKATSTVYIYNPLTNSWSEGPAMPEKLHHMAVTTDGEKLYVVGGYLEGWIPTDSVYVYDPDDKWSELSTMPTKRGALTAEFVNGKIYAIGGYSDVTHATVERYDPEKDVWETMAVMPTPREHLTSSSVDDKIFVIGGRSISGNVNANEVYFTSNDTWRMLEPLPTPRSGITSSVLNSAIFVFGGESISTTFAANEAYVPDSGWFTQEPMKVARHGLASAVVNDKIYLIGGGVSPGFSVSSVNEAYHNTIIPEFGLVFLVFAVSVIGAAILPKYGKGQNQN